MLANRDIYQLDVSTPFNGLKKSEDKPLYVVVLKNNNDSNDNLAN